VSSRKLDARPEADAGGPRLRTMERRWLSELQTHSFAALRLSARMVLNVTIRVLMIVARALPSEPRRALTKGYLWGGRDLSQQCFSVLLSVT
jgi:hypothetical protein